MSYMRDELPVPRIVRWLGCRWRDDSKSYRMRWGELCLRHNQGWDCRLALMEEGYTIFLAFLWLGVSIHLWRGREPHEGMESWGAFCRDGYVGFRWGKRMRNIDIPWRSAKFVSHERLCEDGEFRLYTDEHYDPVTRSIIPKPSNEAYHEETYDYYYLLRRGEVQRRIATCYVERWTWRKFLGIMDVRWSIDIRFNEEIGERTGSWKGGTVGCSWDLKPGETVERCLLRMQEERRFK